MVAWRVNATGTIGLVWSPNAGAVGKGKWPALFAVGERSSAHSNKENDVTAASTIPPPHVSGRSTHARWIAEAFDPPPFDPQWRSEGGWSGQQDSNLPQLIVITQYDSDQQLHRRSGGAPKWAEVLTFLRHIGRRDKKLSGERATQPPDLPPDPGNGRPGAVATATGADVKSALERATEIYRNSDFVVQSVVDLGIQRASHATCSKSRGRR
jgi:hypothetical protein